MKKLLEEHNIKINSVITKYKHTHTHTHTGSMENFDKRLAEKLFKIMDAKEMHAGEVSDKCVKHVLSDVVDEQNKEKNSMTGLPPATAIKRKILELKHK